VVGEGNILVVVERDKKLAALTLQDYQGKGEVG
jgi:hypothetical protein